MATTIRQARAEVQTAFEQALGYIEGAATRTLGEAESELWAMLLALGRAMLVLWLARQCSRPRATQYEHDGRRYVLEGSSAVEIGTLFGKLRFVRRIARPQRDPRGACDRPVDRELGLCGAFSFGVVARITKLCAQLPFATARQLFREDHGWAPSPRAAL